MSSPFIIVTLQRTGGTNFAQRIMEWSELPKAKVHEPFNRPRQYGHITKEFESSGDEIALRRALKEVVEKRENVKHCVEMVPYRLTEILFDEAHKVGYKFIVLVRENALDRLLSLHYARVTGVWGRRPKVVIEEADHTCFEDPLPARELYNHELHCRELLGLSWEKIKSCGGKPVFVSFELLYNSSEERIRLLLENVLDYLGISVSHGKFDALIQELCSGKGQGTRHKYAKFKGINELRSKVSNIEPYGFE